MKLIIAFLFLFFIATTALKSQSAPVITTASLSTSDTAITISVTAVNFINIGSCNLELYYDPKIAKVKGVTTSGLLQGNLEVSLGVPGTISLGWYVFPAKTLAGNPVIFNIEFGRVRTGSTQLTWSDTSNSCTWYDGNYIPLTDTPSSAYYVNGSLTFLPGLGISSGNNEDNRITLKCSPNPFSGNAKLTWSLPSTGNVTVEIFTMTGEKIRTIINEEEQPGYHSQVLASGGLVKGTYLARIILKKKNEVMTKSIKIISE